MSDHRPTARGLVSDWYLTEVDVGLPNSALNRLVAVIAADRAASDAREDRLREALATIRDSVFGTPSWEQRQIAVAALAAIPPRSDR